MQKESVAAIVVATEQINAPFKPPQIIPDISNMGMDTGKNNTDPMLSIRINIIIVGKLCDEASKTSLSRLTNPKLLPVLKIVSSNM